MKPASKCLLFVVVVWYGTPVYPLKHLNTSEVCKSHPQRVIPFDGKSYIFSLTGFTA
jgi:hypothetical protein